MRRDALLAVVACLALAGCVATPAGPTPTSPATETPPSTSTPNSPTRTPTPADADTVAFADLPPDSQDAFETTRRPNGLAVFVPDSPYVEGETFPPEAAAPFAEHEYVRRDGTLFSVELTQGQLYASYRIEASPGSPGPDASVVDYENVSAGRQDAVRTAVENGSYSTELGQWSSAGIEAEYVRYEGETYRLEIVVGDYWARVLRVAPA